VALVARSERLNEQQPSTRLRRRTLHRGVHRSGSVTAACRARCGVTIKERMATTSPTGTHRQRDASEFLRPLVRRRTAISGGTGDQVRGPQPDVQVLMAAQRNCLASYCKRGRGTCVCRWCEGTAVMRISAGVSRSPKVRSGLEACGAAHYWGRERQKTGRASGPTPIRTKTPKLLRNDGLAALIIGHIGETLPSRASWPGTISP
jgi:hypothetical protein